MRGCFGGCTFCSITMHQGRIIQSRSERSILAEVERVAAAPDFKGTVSDVGGPTANMYKMRCTRPEVEAKCRRLSCIHPKICPLLGTDHTPTIELLRKARAVPGVAARPRRRPGSAWTSRCSTPSTSRSSRATTSAGT